MNMNVSEDALMLLKSAIESAKTKIEESFHHIDFKDITGVDLLCDASTYLLAVTVRLEQGFKYGLDDALSYLSQDHLNFKLPPKPEVSDD